MSERQMDALGLRNAGGLRLTGGVRVQGIRPELLLGLMIISDLCHLTETVVMVTHICDGVHMRNSLHYTGAAIDFVTGLDVERAEWVAELGHRLGTEYDVIDEGDHIHVEYQSHHGA